MPIIFIVCQLLSFFCFLSAAEEITPLPSKEALRKGHQNFLDIDFKQHEQEFVRLVREGQAPLALFIGCSDSRVIPEFIVNAAPGKLFVVRAAGNFVPFNEPSIGDGISASIQYGVEVLNVSHIIVCGHSHCGAIKALFESVDAEQLGIVKKWLRFGQEAKQFTLAHIPPNSSKEALLEMAEQTSVLYQLKHLLTFPYIKKRVDEGKIELHGWYFKIETGELRYYNIEEEAFVLLSALSQNKKAV